jgi:hypothetical protein
MKDFDFRHNNLARWPSNSYLPAMQSKNWIAKAPSGRHFLFMYGLVITSPKVSPTDQSNHIEHKDQALVDCHNWTKHLKDIQKACRNGHLCGFKPVERALQESLRQQNTNTDIGSKLNSWGVKPFNPNIYKNY